MARKGFVERKRASYFQRFPLHRKHSMLTSASRALASRLLFSPFFSAKLTPLFATLTLRPFSSASPYPLYYELIHYRPAPRHRPSAGHRHRPEHAPPEDDEAGPDDGDPEPPMDRRKRRYYRKRQKRMFGGSDSEDDRRSKDDGFVELKPEIVDFPRLHAREEELYFYDAFAYPWEKEKHYRMVYQLEKKYFPDQSLDKAFVDPAAERPQPLPTAKKKGKRLGKKDVGEERDERGLVFFDEEEEREQQGDRGVASHDSASREMSEKKVEDFFKFLKKAPNAGGRKDVSISEDGGEPYLVSRKTELPPRWDGPSGTVVLVDKPKG